MFWGYFHIIHHTSCKEVLQEVQNSIHVNGVFCIFDPVFVYASNWAFMSWHMFTLHKIKKQSVLIGCAALFDMDT